MTAMAMSQNDLSRYDTLLRITRRELRVENAATLLALSRHQVCHLLIHIRTDGPACLVLRKRVKPGADSGEAAPRFRDDCAPWFRDDVALFGVLQWLILPVIVNAVLSSRRRRFGSPQAFSLEVEAMGARRAADDQLLSWAPIQSPATSFMNSAR